MQTLSGVTGLCSLSSSSLTTFPPASNSKLSNKKYEDAVVDCSDRACGFSICTQLEDKNVNAAIGWRT